MVRRTNAKKSSQSKESEKVNATSRQPLKRSARNISKSTKYIDSLSDEEEFQEEALSEDERASKKKRGGRVRASQLPLKKRLKKQKVGTSDSEEEQDLEPEDASLHEEDMDDVAAPAVRKSSRARKASAILLESVDRPSTQEDDLGDDSGQDEAPDEYSEEGTETYTTKTIRKSHQLKWSECEEAAEEGLKFMSKYVSVFEPFVTSKVHDKLKHLHDMISRNKKLRDVYYNETVESIGQPNTIINCNLRDYQLEGISWIVDRYDKAMNVILADEMVSSKTSPIYEFNVSLGFGKNAADDLIYCTSCAC